MNGSSRLPAGLLVSARSAAEAEEAVAGGAAIIDVKEPARGALGRADAAVAATIGRAVAGRTAWTVACGELADGERCDGCSQYAANYGDAEAGAIRARDGNDRPRT